MTPQELKVIAVSIQITPDGKAKTYQLAELSLAIDCFNKLKSFVKDGLFIEGDPEFTSEEKVFIKKLIEEQKWTVGDGESVLSVLKQIN